ncbi:MAG: hypothetical protein ACLR23_03105 [Clostridia bacterium]
MKRILSACLQQTIQFQMKDESDRALAAKEIREEYEKYKRQMERKRTQYKIIEEAVQEDGSIIIKRKCPIKGILSRAATTGGRKSIVSLRPPCFTCI